MATTVITILIKALILLIAFTSGMVTVEGKTPFVAFVLMLGAVALMLFDAT